jgi:hypothetical protein
LFSSDKKFNSGDFRLSIPFWESYTPVEFKFSEGNDDRAEGKQSGELQSLNNKTNSLTVRCDFPALMFETAQIQDLLNSVSPAQDKFENLLHSPRGALQQFYTGDVRLTCELVLLDLLRSVSDGWDTFFQNLNLPSVMETFLPEHIGLLEEYEQDVDTSNIISSTIRDFTGCFSFLTSSIGSKLKADLPDGSHRVLEHEVGKHPVENNTLEADYSTKNWDALVIEEEHLNDEIQNMAKDLIERSKRELSFFVANLNEKQANSAKRLTIVASVFLPLTLSASLMAMTTHPRALGDLWYDWVGLCLLTGTIVLVIFFLWKMAQRATNKYPLKSIQPFIPFIIEKISIPWGYLFLCIVTASFLAGMFDTKRVALDILKYGLPCVTALAFLWLAKKSFRYVWICFSNFFGVLFQYYRATHGGNES